MVCCIFLVCVVVSAGCVVNAENLFSHDIDVNHPDSGERVKLKSKGKLSDAIDLDREPGIKRVVCDGDTVLISIKHKGVGRSWKPGQIILGSSKWDCNANTLDSRRRGIYARIKSVYFPTETGISIHVEKAGPFDVIEEAKIKFEYSPGESSKQPPEVRHRHRRYLSNVLSQLMGEINWRANDSTTIPWHIYEGRNSSDVVVYSDSGKSIQIADARRIKDKYNEIFSCRNCGGISEFAYSLDLIISKNEMNEASIQKYHLEVKGNTSIHMKSAFKFDEMKLNISRKVSKQPHHVMLSFPVARIPNDRLPPVMLVVSYDASTHLDMSIDSSAKVDVESDITVKGAYTIAQRYTNNENMSGEITHSNWSISSTNDRLDVEGDLKLQSDLYQRIVFNTSIGWYERDMEIHFSPPIEVSIKPNIVISSSSDGISRCVSDHTGVSGRIIVSDAEFIVNAFGLSLWDTMLAKGFSRNVKFPAKADARKCRADCTAETGHLNKTDIEETCGPMKHRIVRGEANFDSLVQYYGDSVLFLSEEHNVSSWCGHPGRTCRQCTWETDGTETDSKCADRMMDPGLAAGISRLGQLVTAEWPKRKLLVIEAWDEPSSAFPDGQHSNSSIYYEGRAAQLTITDDAIVEGDGVSEAKDVILHITKLRQLALCAGFDFVSTAENKTFVEVAIATEERHITKRKKSGDYYLNNRKSFLNAMDRLEKFVKNDDCQMKNATLKKYQRWPERSTDEVNDVVGGPVQAIKRDNSKQMKRLVEYPFTDIKFLDEDANITGCGIGRQCKICSDPNRDSNTWNWCGTRVMSPRMAVRLRRLALLLKTQKKRSKIAIPEVIKAYSDVNDETDSKLYLEGRALRLNSSDNLDKLGGLAICAGFDFIRNLGSYLEVFVRDQEGFHTTVVTYPSGESFVAVKPPKYYGIPNSFKNAPRIPVVIDAFNKEILLSPYFSVEKFMERALEDDKGEGNTQRYLRVDPLLVGCLEQARTAFRKPFKILNAYRNLQSQVGEKYSWSAQQTEQFQIGRAVHIQPEVKDFKSMKELGLSFFRSCPSTLRLQRMGLGLAVGSDSMYVDVHPLDMNTTIQYVQLDMMTSGKNELATKVYTALHSAWQEMISGGPEIFPYNEEDACQDPELGKGKGYLIFGFHHLGLCFQFGDRKFCEQSAIARNTVFRELWDDLKKVSGSNNLPNEAKDNLEKCVYTSCGGCPGSGKKWDAKVRSCSAVITSFLESLSTPLLRQDQRIAFYNTGNVNSSAHSLACSHETTCAENIQLYSVLQTTVMKTFKPDVNSTNEEMIFGGSDNPSPLLEIVEQELAMAAKGVVDVYIEKIQDLSALKNVIKILMIHNTAVRKVVFHLFHGVRESKVEKILQQRLEMWSGSSCPLWSRFAVAPYAMETVSMERHRRSLHLSRHRNEAHRRINDWEMDWLMKT